MTQMIPRRRREDRWPFRLWAWVRRALAGIGLTVVASSLVGMVLLARLTEARHITPSNAMVLTYALDTDLAEVAEPPSLRNPRLTSGDTLHDVVDALTLAKEDPRVKGFVLRLDGQALSLAQIQELRSAVIAFRQAGKHAAIYAVDYGTIGSDGMGDAYLASAFSDIWVQPIGGMSLPGIAFQVPFLKTLLDKIGVEAQVTQKGAYKSAPESLTSTGMSAPARSNLGAVLEDINAQVVADIALARGIDEANVRSAMDESILTADKALKAKLITRIGYLDECLADAKKRAGQKDTTEGKGAVPLLGYLDLRHSEQSHAENTPVIALITASGEIVDDASASAMGGNLIAPQDMREAFLAVRRNAHVAAIVLRLDSPGGSATASESIRRLILRARERGTPVVVSMSGVAASGGYWIASAADRIVAQPATLTGSIGVFGGKITGEDLLARLGITVETLKSAPHADLWSPARRMTPEESAIISARMQDAYDAFITRVSEGRNLSPEQVEAVAGGQVFSGRQAQKNKLVDQVGGLDVAVKTAAALAKIAPGTALDVVDFPPPASPIERIFALLSGERVALPFKPEAFLVRAQKAEVLAPVAAAR